MVRADAQGLSVRVGTAGWTIPREHARLFPDAGSQLERYARVLPAVEINSSFKRRHRPSTYRRWAESVPPDFRFSVKMPREVTHDRRLVDVESPLVEFLEGVRELGPALGPLLVQLPPSLAFDADVVGAFLDLLGARFEGRAVVEPRHASWFRDDVDRFLRERRVSRVAADPAPAPGADRPGGWHGLVYYRLHGSPVRYRSSYSAEFLGRLAAALRRAAEAERWVIFDNTAEGRAVPDALRLMEMLGLTCHEATNREGP